MLDSAVPNGHSHPGSCQPVHHGSVPGTFGTQGHLSQGFFRNLRGTEAALAQGSHWTILRPISRQEAGMISPKVPCSSHPPAFSIIHILKGVRPWCPPGSGSGPQHREAELQGLLGQKPQPKLSLELPESEGILFSKRSQGSLCSLLLLCISFSRAKKSMDVIQREKVLWGSHLG